MTEDRELEAWRNDWSSVATAVPPEDLIVHVRKQSRKQLRAAIGEASASLFLIVVCVLLIRRQPIAPVVAFAMAMCLYVGVWLTYFFLIRVGSWGHAGSNVRDYVARSRQMHAIELRWARFTRACMVALIAFFVAWSPWVIVTKWQLYRTAPWRGVVGFGIASCIFALVWMWNRRKLRLLLTNQATFAEQTRALEE